MPENKKTIKIFIASSNELKEEREKCILLVNQLNKSHKHLHLEAIEWEIDMFHSNYPEYKNIQDAINPKLKESDLVIFIFYSKIGKYTLEEFEFANSENKKLFAFFKEGFSPKTDTLESYGALLKFKESLNDTVLYKEYKNLDIFEKLFFPNLNLYLTETYPILINEDDRISVATLSQSNQQLIQLLAEKEKEIAVLKESNKQLPDSETQNQLQGLSKEIEAIKSELLKSEELQKQLAQEKESLEKQLAPQIELDNLKAKALEELEKGNYTEAENFLLQSAKESVEETASTFFELAKIKKLQLQYSEALNFYELAVKINPNNGLYFNEAGIMADTMGFYNRAIEYYKKTLGIQLRIYGEKDTEIAKIYNNIGLANNNKAEYHKAIEYYEKSLEIVKKILGEEHPSIALRYGNIGISYCNKGEFENGIEYFEKALSINKKFYGENHTSITLNYNNIGTAYVDKNEYRKAIEYFEKALIIGEKVFAENSPEFAVWYNNIGTAYDCISEYDKAIEYYEKALLIGKKVLGEEHPKIAIRYNNMGLAYEHKGNYDYAIKYYEKALIIDQKFHGEDHPDTAIDYNNIASILTHKNEYSKALDFFEKALYIFLKFLPEAHPSIQTVKKNIEIVKKNIEIVKKAESSNLQFP